MRKTLLFLTLLASVGAKAQWQSSNLDPLQITSIDTSGNYVLVGTTGGLYVSTDNGVTWPSPAIFPSVYPISSAIRKGTVYFAGTNNGMRRSVNDGAYWALTPTLVNFPVFSILRQGANIYATSQLGVHVSNNNGGTWTSVSNGLPELTPPHKIVANGSNLFVVADSTVYTTNNNGALWSSANTGLENHPVLTLTSNGASIFAGTRHGVFESSNNGGTWTAINAGISNVAVKSIAISNNKLFAATANGVYASFDNGASWALINNGLPSTEVNFLMTNSEYLFAGLRQQTPSGELWFMPLSELTATSQLESNINLEVYPNPTTGVFRISTTDLGIETVDIYNVLGKLVLHLNTNGNNVELINLSGYPEGVYYINATSVNGDRLSRKVVVE